MEFYGRIMDVMEQQKNELERTLCGTGVYNSSKNISILIYLDNMTAVAYTHHGGGTRSRAVTQISATHTEWDEGRKIAIVEGNLRGKLNVVADKKSRAGPDAGDWRLKISVFIKVQSIFQSNLDVFESHWNAQLPSII